MDTVAEKNAPPESPVSFQTDPSRYRHWKLGFEGPVAVLTMDVRDDQPLRPGYQLKLNSYDLGVDVELADAIQRIRFEHPEARSVLLRSGKDRIFSAGANIYMLGTSSHPFKVNFCKYTNDTRCGIEDASRHSGVKFLCACSGVTAGGGYELALACDEIHLVDDGNSAVSLPEVPLLGVLPGTGGLTRLVDKRKVRRDRADVFATTAEGMKGKRALEWGLVDAIHPRARFEEATRARAREIAGPAPTPLRPGGKGIALSPVMVRGDRDVREYGHVTLRIDRPDRVATLTVRGPGADEPKTPEEFLAAGDRAWALAAFREIDDALLHLRVNELETGVVILRTEGDLDRVLAVDRALEAGKSHWFVNEIRLHMARVLRRLDLSSRSLFALADGGSCFGGTLLELALAADRAYMLDDAKRPVRLATSPLNGGPLPMAHGLTRLEARFRADAGQADRALATRGPIGAKEALALGLVTFAPDEIDWEDTVRIAIEERASLSPDALTGLEANLRFAGPETCESKIYGRLSAWQNWIFIRPNATGERGALTSYGKATPPQFDWRRA
ncbi:MAG: 2,3-epoxybenzoyl-CoA dihydrolase [Planctomycetales bacterium]|nr:2,3-epoxybenzoyl-CoA dihydrolase [Planctomycetales bacterium]